MFNKTFYFTIITIAFIKIRRSKNHCKKSNVYSNNSWRNDFVILFKMGLSYFIDNLSAIHNFKFLRLLCLNCNVKVYSAVTCNINWGLKKFIVLYLITHFLFKTQKGIYSAAPMKKVAFRFVIISNYLTIDNSRAQLFRENILEIKLVKLWEKNQKRFSV